MVTKLSDGRGQITLKGHGVDDDWERLIKGAAKRNGQTVSDFVVHSTREAAQAILKGQSAVPAALPARPEDLADLLTTRMNEMAERLAASQAEAAERQRQEQAERDLATVERVERLERQQAEQRALLERQWAEEQRAARRGRWRR